MSGDFTLWIIFGYFEEVGSEAHFQLTFGLTDILYAASFASHTINQVGARAAHIEPAHVCTTRGGTKYSAICVQLGAVPACVRSEALVIARGARCRLHWFESGFHQQVSKSLKKKN